MLVNRHRNLVISLVRLSAVATSLLMLTILIVTSSQAAFSDTTANNTNTFSTGSVIINDDAASALFTATAMTAGSPVVECIVLTYTGSTVPADIRMYGTSSGALAPYLDTTVELGTGGSNGSCGGFSSSSTLYSGTLANFSTTHTNWATGLATFTAAANPTARTLRFTVDVQNVAAAQSKTASANFVWEARD